MTETEKRCPTTCDCCCNCEGTESYGKPRDQCLVLVEIRGIKTPTGLEAARLEYQNRFQKAATNPTVDVSHRLQKLGVPGQAIIAARNPDNSEAIQAARRFIDAHKTRIGALAVPFLTLIGEVGVGKTVAAVLALQDFCRKWQWNDQPSGGDPPLPAMFVPASGLTGLNPKFNEGDRRFLRDMARTRMLVLDDCGEEGADDARQAVHDVLKTRLDTNKRTAITGNITPAAFTQRYGKDLAERINTKSIRPDLSKSKSMRRPEPRT